MTETGAARIAKGSAYLMIQNVATEVIGLIAFAFVARLLTREEMGITVAFTLTVVVAEVISDLGFSSGLTKYIAEYRGRDADYTPISFTGVTMKMLMAGLIAIICVLAAPQLSKLLLKTGEYAVLFQLLSVVLLFACVNTTMNGILLGLNKIREIAILKVLAALTRRTLAVALLMLGCGLTGFVIGWIFGVLTYAAASTWIILKGKHLKVHPIEEVSEHLEMLTRFSWPLFLTGVVVFIYNWFDRTILLTSIPLGQLAVYNVAFTAFGVLAAIPLAISASLFPYYSEKHGRKRHENITFGVRATTRYIALFYTPLALGLVATANAFITLFAGGAYADGDVILAFLSLFGALSGISAVFRVLLLVYNMTPSILIINMASVGISLVAFPFVLPTLGIAGVAIVRGIAMIVSLILVIIVLRRKMPINFDREALWKSWTAAVTMALAVWLIQQACFSRYLMPIYVLAGGVIYMTGLKILKAVNKNDLQLIRNLLGRRATPLMGILEKILT